MSDIIGNPHLKMDVETATFEKGLDTTEAKLGASLQRSQRIAAGGTKRIQAQIDLLNAAKPRQSMFELTQAVQKMGGVFNLTSDQIGRLKKQVDALAAAGARVPKILQGLPGGGGGAAGPGLLSKAGGAAVGHLAGQLTPGGAISAGLTAIGPAGVAAAASVGAVAAAAKAASETVGTLVERAGRLTDIAEKTGISTDALQKLDFVGAQVGVSLDASAGAVLKLQRTLGDAAAGSQEARHAFEDVGISWKDLIGLKPEEQFARVASALGTIPDQERLVKAGADLMGKGFAEIIPLVQHANEVMSAPVELDERVIAQADGIGDAFTRMGKAVDEVKMQLGVALVQGFSGSADASAAIDTITNAVRGLAAILGGDTFVSAIRTFDKWTLGIGRTVDALAQLGEGERMKGVAKFAEAFGKQNAQRAKVAEAQTAAAGRTEREKAAKDAAAKAKEAAQKQEQLRLKTIASGKALADEEAKFRSDTNKRQQVEAEKFWAGQVDLSRDSTEKMLATALLGQGISPTATNALGQKIAIVSQKAMEEARRRASAGMGGSGQLLGDIADEGLPTRLWSRFKDVNDELAKGTKQTIDWSQQLENLAHTFSLMGMKADSSLGRIVVGLTSGLAAAQDLKKQMGEGGFGSLSKNQKLGAAMGGLSTIASIRAQAGGMSGLLGGAAQGAAAGSAFGPWGAAIGGIAGGLLGLFKSDPIKKAQKEAGTILGKGISREMAEQFVEESKRTGKSVAQVARQWQAEQEKAAADAKRKNVEEGLNAARSGFEALLGDIAKLQDTPALQGAIAGIEAKIAEALAKSGLGFMATGVLRGSEAFGAAQGAAKSGGQVLSGMRQAGMVDAGLQAAMTGLATELQRQAIDAARAAGLSDEEAAKAGSGAIVDLLREQLNASLASGKELDTNTQALIDEARANGIEIIADPMLQQLKVQQQSLTQLEEIKGLMAGGGAAFDKFGSFVSGRTFSAQTGLPPAIMPNMGGGVGPLIQTHPGELALVIPRTQVAGGRRSLARGALPVGNDAFDPRPDPGDMARAAAEAARGPLALTASFPIKFDQSVSFETAQHFARAVAKEARRLFDQADPDVMRAVRRRLGLAT